jgi:hypothetical protein
MNGVEKIFYFPAAVSADSFHSQYDIPELIGEAKVPASFLLVNLGDWNDHPLVIQAIFVRLFMCVSKVVSFIFF